MLNTALRVTLLLFLFVPQGTKFHTKWTKANCINLKQKNRYLYFFECYGYQ